MRDAFSRVGESAIPTRIPEQDGEIASSFSPSYYFFESTSEILFSLSFSLSLFLSLSLSLTSFDVDCYTSYFSLALCRAQSSLFPTPQNSFTPFHTVANDLVHSLTRLQLSVLTESHLLLQQRTGTARTPYLGTLCYFFLSLSGTFSPLSLSFPREWDEVRGRRSFLREEIGTWVSPLFF